MTKKEAIAIADYINSAVESATDSYRELRDSANASYREAIAIADHINATIDSANTSYNEAMAKAAYISATMKSATASYKEAARAIRASNRTK